MDECSSIAEALKFIGSLPVSRGFDFSSGQSCTVGVKLVDGKVICDEVIEDEPRSTDKLETQVEGLMGELHAQGGLIQQLSDNCAEVILERDRAKTMVAELAAQLINARETIRRLADENAAMRYLIDEVRYDAFDCDDGDAHVDDARALDLSNAMRAPDLMRIEDL